MFLWRQLCWDFKVSVDAVKVDDLVPPLETLEESGDGETLSVREASFPPSSLASPEPSDEEYFLMSLVTRDELFFAFEGVVDISNNSSPHFQRNSGIYNQMDSIIEDWTEAQNLNCSIRNQIKLSALCEH